MDKHGTRHARRRALRERKWREEKRWRELERERSRLGGVIWNAPVVEIEHPFQRGWVRYFTIADSARGRRDAEDLLAAAKLVENRQYCRLNKFLERKRHKGGRRARGHHPKRFRVNELLWKRPPERLLKYFETERGICIGGYVRLLNLHRTGFPGRIRFAEYRNLRSVTEPFMITHVRVLRPDAERRVAEVEREFTRRDLYRKLARLHGCRGEAYWNKFEVDRRARLAELDAREQILSELGRSQGDTPIQPKSSKEGAGDRAFFLYCPGKKRRPPSDVDDDRLRVGLDGICLFLLGLLHYPFRGRGSRAQLAYGVHRLFRIVPPPVGRNTAGFYSGFLNGERRGLSRLSPISLRSPPHR